MKTILTPLFALLFISSSLFAQQESVKLCAQVDQNGLDVDVNIYVSDFVNIGSVQFGVAWEANKYDFASFENIHSELTNLAYNAQEGENIPDVLSLLNLVWFDETGITPRTLSDETLICTLKLTQKTAGENGQIGIAPEEDFMIEFSNGDIELIGHEIEGPNCSVLAFSTLTNTKDITIDELVVSPNPFNDVLNISLENELTGSFSVYSVTGKLVDQFNFKNKQEVTLSLNNLDAGTYILTQKSEDGLVLGQSKIVKL